MTAPPYPTTMTNQQAEYEGLWFQAETAPEHLLQQALRMLHSSVEYWLTPRKVSEEPIPEDTDYLLLIEEKVFGANEWVKKWRIDDHTIVDDLAIRVLGWLPLPPKKET